jgi:hypothetical protein
MTTRKSSPKTPQERAEIAKAVTTQERLEAVNERLDPNSSIPRKTLQMGVSLNKGNSGYGLIEEISYFKGYPVGAELDQDTGRVIFKYTKEDGNKQWRQSEELLEIITDTFRAILTAVITTESMTLLDMIRDEATKCQDVSQTGQEGVKKLFRWIKEYRRATADIRAEVKLREAKALVASLSDEAKRELLQQTSLPPMSTQGSSL